MFKLFQEARSKKQEARSKKLNDNLLKPKILMRMLEPRIMLDASLGDAIIDIVDISQDSVDFDKLADFYNNPNSDNPANSEKDITTLFNDFEPPVVRSSLSNQSNNRNEIVIIDSSVTNYEVLAADANSEGNTVYIIGKDQGIDEITRILATYENQSVDALHIISHGGDGFVEIGNSVLDSSNIAETENWKNAFSEDADILIYGCDVAQTQKGANFINQLLDSTQTDIAASDDITGSKLKGGDWDLELKKGVIETDFALSTELRNQYKGVLFEWSSSSDFDYDSGSDYDNNSDNSSSNSDTDFSDFDFSDYGYSDFYDDDNSSSNSNSDFSNFDFSDYVYDDDDIPDNFHLGNGYENYMGGVTPSNTSFTIGNGNGYDLFSDNSFSNFDPSLDYSIDNSSSFTSGGNYAISYNNVSSQPYTTSYTKDGRVVTQVSETEMEIRTPGSIFITTVNTKDFFFDDGFNIYDVDKEGFGRDGLNEEGRDRLGRDADGYYEDGFNDDDLDKEGFGRDGLNEEGRDRLGRDAEGYYEDGFNDDDLDKEGFGRDGLNEEGRDRLGRDAEGYYEDGFNDDDVDKEGFGRDGLNEKGRDRVGRDADGYYEDGFNDDDLDKEGFGRDGLNEKGRDRVGRDADGYYEDGFNEVVQFYGTDF